MTVVGIMAPTTDHQIADKTGNLKTSSATGMETRNSVIGIMAIKTVANSGGKLLKKSKMISVIVIGRYIKIGYLESGNQNTTTRFLVCELLGIFLKS